MGCGWTGRWDVPKSNQASGHRTYTGCSDEQNNPDVGFSSSPAQGVGWDARKCRRSIAGRIPVRAERGSLIGWSRSRFGRHAAGNGFFCGLCIVHLTGVLTDRIAACILMRASWYWRQKSSSRPDFLCRLATASAFMFSLKTDGNPNASNYSS